LYKRGGEAPGGDGVQGPGRPGRQGVSCRQHTRPVVKGSPVQSRRGPATVTGEARRTHSVQPLGRRRRLGKARRVVPEARRPASGDKPTALVERGGSA
jgi:hypothetical protein